MDVAFLYLAVLKLFLHFTYQHSAYDDSSVRKHKICSRYIKKAKTAVTVSTLLAFNFLQDLCQIILLQTFLQNT